MLLLLVSPPEMFRSLLVVLAFFTELIFRDVFFVASLDHETCSARNQDCNTEEKKYPQLVRLDGVKVRLNELINC